MLPSPQRIAALGQRITPASKEQWIFLASLLDPQHLTVALSRAKRKIILVGSRSNVSPFSADEKAFANSLLWKNLLLRTCSTLLWEGSEATSGWWCGAAAALARADFDEKRVWLWQGGPSC
jgi:hypothetical protein